MSPAEQGWAPTRALGRAVLLAGLLMLLAVLLGRLDLVVLAAPFALGVGWALIRRPTASPGVRVALSEESVNEGGAVSATIALSNPDEVGYDAVVARTTYSPWLRLKHGDRPY